MQESCRGMPRCLHDYSMVLACILSYVGLVIIIHSRILARNLPSICPEYCLIFMQDSWMCLVKIPARCCVCFLPRTCQDHLIGYQHRRLLHTGSTLVTASLSRFCHMWPDLGKSSLWDLHVIRTMRVFWTRVEICQSQDFFICIYQTTLLTVAVYGG